MSIKSSFGVDKAKQFSTLPVGWWGQNRAVGKGGGGQSHPYFGRNKSKQNGLDFLLDPRFSELPTALVWDSCPKRYSVNVNFAICTKTTCWNSFRDKRNVLPDSNAIHPVKTWAIYLFQEPPLLTTFRLRNFFPNIWKIF